MELSTMRGGPLIFFVSLFFAAGLLYERGLFLLLFLSRIIQNEYAAAAPHII
jgi:hypothetical protein